MSVLPPLGTPSSDPTVHYPELAPIRELTAVRDWPLLVKQIEALSPELQYLAVNTAGPRILRVGADEIVTTMGDSSTTARVLAASAYIDAGWKIRSGYQAQYVNQSQFQGFHEHLRLAEQQLIEATAHQPDNAVAWTLRITSARGLELGENEAKRRYAQLSKHHPHYFGAQVQLIQQLCPKWGGTWEQAHAFARESTQNAPEGASNGALVPDVYIEQWLFAEGNAGIKLLKQESVQAEVRAAAARSVLHPAAAPQPGWVMAHNFFAMFWCLAGDFAAAATHFRAIGNRVSDSPWSYLGDEAIAAFTKNRNKALAKG